MKTEMDREELIKKFFELVDADELVVRAWGRRVSRCDNSISGRTRN